MEMEDVYWRKLHTPIEQFKSESTWTTDTTSSKQVCQPTDIHFTVPHVSDSGQKDLWTGRYMFTAYRTEKDLRYSNLYWLFFCVSLLEWAHLFADIVYCKYVTLFWILLGFLNKEVVSSLWRSGLGLLKINASTKSTRILKVELNLFTFWDGKILFWAPGINVVWLYNVFLKLLLCLLRDISENSRTTCKCK